MKYLLLLATLALTRSEVRFDGDQVLRFKTPTQQDVEMIHTYLRLLTETFDDIFEFDIWREPTAGGFADIHVERQHLEVFKRSAPLPFSVFVADLQQSMDAQKRRSRTGDWFDEYHTLAELNERLFQLVEQYENVPGLSIELINIGQSFENRTIWGVHFHGQDEQRVGMFWNGAQHAREWISPATIFFQMERFLAGYGVDREITELIDAMDFHVVPVVNVDGYQFTWTTNRNWRKTRSSFDNGQSFGTDSNRNWDHEWSGVGASDDPRSDIYHGPFPFSEPEVVALSDYILQFDNIHGHIDWHSYGQYILSPWGFTPDLPPDHDDHTRFGNIIEVATRAVNGNAYLVGPSGVTLYPTSGGAKDYAYAELDIKYTFTIELPGNPGGFELPPEFIIPVGEESLAGTLEFCRLLLEEYL